MTENGAVRIAFVTLRFPPMVSTGTIRVSALRRHLGQYGIRTTFVTIPLEWMRQQGKIMGLEESSNRLEVDVLQPSSRSDLMMRVATRVRVLRRLQRWLFIPDVLAMWARSAGRRVASSLADVDAVYATGPPFSAYILGRSLAHRLGVPLVLELRDPPRLDRRSTSRGPLYSRRLEAFERRHILAADRVVTLTPGVKKHLLASYPELPAEQVVVVPNGFDPMTRSHGHFAPLPSRVFSMVYTGSLRSRDDVRLLNLITSCLSRLPVPGVLRMVGEFAESTRNALSQATIEGIVSWEGRVTHDQALLELRQSDASIVLVGDSEGWWIGRKVVESLAHAPQILALAPPGDVTDLLEQSSKSIVVCRDAAEHLVEEAIGVLYDRVLEPKALNGPEPFVPTDLEVAKGVADAVRSAISGGWCKDWDWAGAR